MFINLIVCRSYQCPAIAIIDLLVIFVLNRIGIQA